MESKAVRDLYERYGYAVHRRCLRLLGSSAEADDALQAVFVRVMRWGGLKQSEAPLPWLYRIADRVCFDQLKLRRRQASPEESLRQLEQRAEQSSAVARRTCRRSQCSTTWTR
jgi:RNA polymerase sigma-70 factor (ECF subfamily)